MQNHPGGMNSLHGKFEPRGSKGVASELKEIHIGRSGGVGGNGGGGFGRRWGKVQNYAGREDNLYAKCE